MPNVAGVISTRTLAKKIANYVDGRISFAVNGSTDPSTYLIVDSPFDEDFSDNCGNAWIVHEGSNDTPVISNHQLSLPASSWLELNNSIWLGGRDFTIAVYFCWVSGTPLRDRAFFSLFNAQDTTVGCINLKQLGSNRNVLSQCFGSNTVSFEFSPKFRYYFACVYSHDESTYKVFLDGECKATLQKTIPRTHFPHVYLGKSNYSNDATGTGEYSHFKIYDGVALYS